MTAFACFTELFVTTKTSYGGILIHAVNIMDSKDSKAATEAYWLLTVLEDRAESAPPPAPAKTEDGR
jgi:hypothetical protein